MPGDDGKTPWRIEYRDGVTVAKNEEEDVGSSDGSESGAENKFAALKSREAKAKKEIACGEMHSILLDCGKPPTEEEEAKAKARSATRKKQRAKCKARASSKKRRRENTGCYLAGSDDETESSESVVKKRKTTKAKATGSTDEPTPIKSEHGTPQKQREDAAPLELDFAEGDEDEKPKARGAPEKDARIMAESQWKAFAIADKSSSFFNERCCVTRRLLGRWISKAGPVLTIWPG
jgi:hypothetical protein